MVEFLLLKRWFLGGARALVHAAAAFAVFLGPAAVARATIADPPIFGQQSGSSLAGLQNPVLIAVGVCDGTGIGFSGSVSAASFGSARIIGPDRKVSEPSRLALFGTGLLASSLLNPRQRRMI